jgi:hypothetical protein
MVGVSSKTFDDLINLINGNLSILEQKFLHFTPRIAYQILTNPGESEKVLSALLNLQSVHGIVLGLHPESVYSEDYKVRGDTIFNKIIEVSSESSKFIEVTLDVYQTLKAKVPPFIGNESYCYIILTSTLHETQWSFYGLILRVINNMKKILSYLTNIAELEKTKGKLAKYRIKGEAEAGTPTIQPPPKSILDEKVK